MLLQVLGVNGWNDVGCGSGFFSLDSEDGRLKLGTS